MMLTNNVGSVVMADNCCKKDYSLPNSHIMEGAEGMSPLKQDALNL